MSVELLFAYFGGPSLSELKQRQASSQGLADGLAGEPPRSHAREYSACYLTGNLFRRAGDYELVVVFGPASQCPTCRSVVEEAGQFRCDCTSIPVFMERGVTVAFGPAEPDDDPEFMSSKRLRQLCADGIEAVTMKGESLTQQILTQ